MATRHSAKPAASGARIRSAGTRSASNRPTSNTSINNSASRAGSASKERIYTKPSDRLNPKTSDPVCFVRTIFSVRSFKVLM